MRTNLNEFQKQKELLICIDSDGCAMDTMDIKHIRCFGPCMVEEWGLSAWEAPILDRWNAINLYTMTRGINRFQGLAKALTEIEDCYWHEYDYSARYDEINRYVGLPDIKNMPERTYKFVLSPEDIKDGTFGMTFYYRTEKGRQYEKITIIGSLKKLLYLKK